MNDPKADKAETKPLVKISNKVIEFEEYESVMRQSRKVLTRMDEVLDNSTNIPRKRLLIGKNSGKI